MKMNKPIGNAMYAPLILRLPLGTYFLLAGWFKLQNLNAFVHEVQQFKILPEPAATLYGILLPYLEVACGALIILGLYTTLAAIVSSFILATIIYAFGWQGTGGKLINKDIILLGGTFSLMFSGAGFFSIDHFRASGS